MNSHCLFFTKLHSTIFEKLIITYLKNVLITVLTFPFSFCTIFQTVASKHFCNKQIHHTHRLRTSPTVRVYVLVDFFPLSNLHLYRPNRLSSRFLDGICRGCPTGPRDVFGLKRSEPKVSLRSASLAEVLVLKKLTDLLTYSMVQSPS